MPCILKIPNKQTKGIVTFTTVERDSCIINNSKIENELKELKKSWLIGIHHNWHDYNFHYNSLFDFHLAGKDDLIEQNNLAFFNSDIDCCNFPPENFLFNNSNKHWDLLCVARPAFFKRIDKFYSIIRELYNKKIYFRILLICWESKKLLIKEHINFNNYREIYLKKFSNHERKYFNLISLANDSPLDTQTLSFFYKFSKVYIHTSDSERRSRTASYALKAGMPVICMKDIASIVPRNLQTTPYIFLARSYNDFSSLIVKSINFVSSKYYTNSRMKKIINFFSYKKNSLKLINFFQKLDKKYSKKDLRTFNLNNLDYRLGVSYISNSYNNIDSFLNYLKNQPYIKLKKDSKAAFFEKEIERYKLFYSKKTYPKGFLVKNIKSYIVRIAKYILS